MTPHIVRQNRTKFDLLFVLALFSFGLYYYCFRILGADLSYTPGDNGDSRFINYVLEHGYKWLRGIEPDFWRANFMYPLKNNIAISDSMAGSLPIYAMFRFLGYGSETAYQLWWLSCCLLNFIFCFFSFKRLGFDLKLCAIGAFVFAYGINNFNQFVHLQVNCKFLVPVIISYLYSFLNQPKNKYFILITIAFVFQFYCNAYIAIFALLFCVLFSGFYLIDSHHRIVFIKQLNKPLVLRCIVASALGCVFILLVALPYYNMSQTLGRLSYSHISGNLPTLYSYFLPNENTSTWNFLKDSPLKSEPAWYIHDLFPGAFVYFGFISSFFYIAYCLYKKKRIQALPLILAVCSLLFLLFFSRAKDHSSLFKFFQDMPILSSMRLPNRFLIVINFVFIWLSLYFFTSLFKQKTVLLSLLLFAVVFIDNRFDVSSHFPRTSKMLREARTQAMCSLIEKKNTDHNKIIAVLNISDQPESFQLDVMLATQRLNLYTLNGYSSNCFGNLCYAYTDPYHKKLSDWLKEWWINESKVTFISI